MAQGWVAVAKGGIWGMGASQGEAVEQARRLSPQAVADATLSAEPASRSALAVLAQGHWSAEGGFDARGVEALDGFWIRARIDFAAYDPSVGAAALATTAVVGRPIQLARLRLEAAALEYALSPTEASQASLLAASRQWAMAVRSHNGGRS